MKSAEHLQTSGTRGGGTLYLEHAIPGLAAGPWKEEVAGTVQELASLLGRSKQELHLGSGPDTWVGGTEDSSKKYSSLEVCCDGSRVAARTRLRDRSLRGRVSLLLSEALSVAASAAPHAVAGGKEGWNGSLVRPQLQVIEGRVPLMTGCSREPLVTAPPAHRFPTVRRQAAVLFFPETPWGN